MRTAAVVLLVIAAMLGCQGSPSEISQRRGDALIRSSDHDLAFGYGATRSATLRQEITRRNLFTEDQWTRLDRGAIKPGDSALFVMAAWGDPDEAAHTTSTHGESATWYYRHNTTRPHAYGIIVLHDFKVQSITQ